MSHCILKFVKTTRRILRRIFSRIGNKSHRGMRSKSGFRLVKDGWRRDLKKAYFNFVFSLFQATSNQNKTISPIYLSRMLNSVCCSISVCRDEPLSITAMIELSRRFTIGLWNCIQFLICCGCSIALINVISALLALPPVIPPITGICLMCVTCPLIAASLARISSDRKVGIEGNGGFRL